MTPISELTNAELDELIFKLQGWVKLQPPAYPKWQHPGIDGTKLWFEDYIPSPTTDPRYAMELLLELIETGYTTVIYADKGKYYFDMESDEVFGIAGNLYRAISEAYAQWKGEK